MLKRILSAIILIPVVFYSIFKLSLAYFTALTFFIAFIAFSESIFMVKNRFATVKDRFIVFFSLFPILFFGVYFLKSGEYFKSGFLSTLIFFLCVSVFLFSKKLDVKTIFASSFLSIAFYFYIFTFFGFAILIRFNIDEKLGSFLVLLWLLINWFGDTFAYFGGRFFGKNRLSPVVSPKKTIEGTVFGILGGMAAGMLMYHFFLSNFPFLKLAFISILTQMIGQIGDLLESVIKRYFGVKDSSNLIPGHGGMFDRIDSLIFSAPFFYYFLKLLMV